MDRKTALHACGGDGNPRYLIRDHDAIYGRIFQRQAAALSIEAVLTAPGSPWQNTCAERVIGSIHRECVNHMVVLGERHLKRLLLRICGLLQLRTHPPFTL